MTAELARLGVGEGLRDSGRSIVFALFFSGSPWLITSPRAVAQRSIAVRCVAKSCARDETQI